MNTKSNIRSNIDEDVNDIADDIFMFIQENAIMSFIATKLAEQLSEMFRIEFLEITIRNCENNISNIEKNIDALIVKNNNAITTIQERFNEQIETLEHEHNSNMESLNQRYADSLNEILKNCH